MRMKKREFLSIVRRWNGGGAQSSNEPQGGEPAGAKGEKAPEPIDFDERIKSDPVLQSWLDKRVTAATGSAVQKALEKERLLASEKATEAEKLAAMSEKEKAAYELKKAQDEIARLKQAENIRGLKDQALKIAAEKEVPAALVELLPFSEMKAEDVSQNIHSLKEVYSKAVADGIAHALSGAGAPSGSAKGAESNPKQGLMEIINDGKRPLVERVAARTKLYELKEE